jgi:BolA protein
MTTHRIERIKSILEADFAPELLEVDDESHLHEGHAGARSGMGHFRVMIVSERFEGMGRLQRHQAVFRALADMMETDIHALSITALAPSEI